MDGKEWKPKLNEDFMSDGYKSIFIAKKWSPPAVSSQRNVGKRADNDGKGLDFLYITFTICILFLIQAILAVGSYSGEGIKPLHGDFEAQRHWLEITYNLPISQWYVNGTDNDLLYWGLDYPPLTAYHSWFMGYVANKINPMWITLHSSRGVETPLSKLFMRITAAAPYYSLYIPIVLALCALAKCDKFSKNTLFACISTYSGLLVIDCAHFQYNSISLGLFLGAYLALTEGYTLFGSVFFCLAVNYKQMELYHALPIFIFILARSIRRPLLSRVTESIRAIIPVGVVVLTTFAIIWAPFLLLGKPSVFSALGRIFPFYRGLYEDKVASVWCALSPVLKLNRLMDHASLLRLCTASVILSSLPSLLVLFNRPTAKNFRYSLFLTSLSFFLLSFQVHEKSILLPAVVALIFLPEYPAEISWFLHIANTSLFSLCIKDRTEMTLVLFVAYYIFCNSTLPKFDSQFLQSLKNFCCLLAVVICLAEWFLPPPASFPHIFPLLNAVYSCCNFVGFYLFFTFKMLGEEYQKWSKKTS